MESLSIGFGDMNDLLTDVDAVVPVYGAYLVECYNKRTMNTHEAVGGQHVLDRFHCEMGDERALL